MAHALIMRDGSIVHGTGADRRPDIATGGGRITAIVDVASASARRELDATALVVSPGCAATIVNRVVMRAHRTNTGERPGRVVRDVARG